METKREYTTLGDAVPDAELDSRLEAMERQAEEDVEAGRWPRAAENEAGMQETPPA